MTAPRTAGSASQKVRDTRDVICCHAGVMHIALVVLLMPSYTLHIALAVLLPASYTLHWRSFWCHHAQCTLHWRSCCRRHAPAIQLVFPQNRRWPMHRAHTAHSYRGFFVSSLYFSKFLGGDNISRIKAFYRRQSGAGGGQSCKQTFTKFEVWPFFFLLKTITSELHKYK